jgi:hypothetical protein
MPERRVCSRQSDRSEYIFSHTEFFPAEMDSIVCIHWRLRQIEERLNMAEAHRAVLAETEWNPGRLAAAAEFIAAKERLYRRVWRLGLQRHCFRFETYMPGWYDEFVRLSGGKKAGSIADTNAQV